MRHVQETSAVAGLFTRLRSVWRGVRGRAEVEAGMSEEFSHHLELRTEDLIRRGIAPREAARRARIEFGHVETHKEAARASRGLHVFDQIHFSWLDVKLGLRMLRKYPALSLVSVIGMSVAIAIAAGYYGAIGALIDPSLPLDEGDRIVSLQNVNLKPGDDPWEPAHDFVAWRSELKSIRDLAAFRTQSRNAIVEGKSAEVVDVAEITAAGFRVARVAPVLGRPILDEDELEGAPPVVVIAYEEWQNRFDADPAILGRTVGLGSMVHTVVGVMPAEFRFPRHHRFWVPLRLNVNAYPRGDGPWINMFGRLADGVSLEQAQAELSAIGQRDAAAYPQTNEYLRPKVSPYTYPFMNIGSPAQALAFRTLQLAIGLLLVVVALNVAVLVYARTSTRAGEIAVRIALGASRRRVLTQLFAEAFVLSVISAVIGLGLAFVGLRIIKDFNDRPTGDFVMPFWVDIGLSPSVIGFVAGLAILAGLIIGVLPGLKVTSRLQAGLQQLTSRGKSKQLGRTWTALIVIQVAIAVAILPFAMYVAGKSVMVSSRKSQIPGAEILRARVVMRPELGPSATMTDEAKSPLDARFVDRTTELLRRIEAEPGVAGAALSTFFPGQSYFSYKIEVDGGARTQNNSAESTPQAQTVGIAPDLFAVIDVPIVEGRAFVEADAAQGSNVAIVDRVFADQILGGGAVIGRRVRIVEPAKFGETPKPGMWLEIVGVVPHFVMADGWGPPDPMLYVPLTTSALADGYLHLAVRTRGGSADAFARRLTDITAAVDPTLQLQDLNSAADFDKLAREFLLFLATSIAALTASVLLLSATGIYAMMSFTVEGRRREIGIRTALGADRRRVLSGVFARAAAQLGAGVLAGLILAALVNQVAGDNEFGNSFVMFPLVAVLIITVGLLSALGPARRVLSVQPTEALRGE